MRSSDSVLGPLQVVPVAGALGETVIYQLPLSMMPGSEIGLPTLVIHRSTTEWPSPPGMDLRISWPSGLLGTFSEASRALDSVIADYRGQLEEVLQRIDAGQVDDVVPYRRSPVRRHVGVVTKRNIVYRLGDEYDDVDPAHEE